VIVEHLPVNTIDATQQPNKQATMFLSFAANIYGSRAADLQEPLLSEKVVVPKEIAIAPEETASTTSSTNTGRLQQVSFLTGSFLAYLSQVLLCALLWNKRILAVSSTAEIVAFSLQWSFWTCLMVFVGMLGLIRVVQKLHHPAAGALDDATVFHMEVYYVVGALLTVSAEWICQNVMRDADNASLANNDSIQMLGPHPGFLVAVAVPTYLLLAFGLLRQPSNTSASNQSVDASAAAASTTVVPPYRLLAGLLGFVVGVSYQFFLSLLLWQGNDTRLRLPVVEDVIYFSLLWSGLTVTMTFCACLSLRLVVPPEQSGVLLLRMEATYISCSLVGICVAWILIDLMSGMPEQVLPSMAMLVVSLGCFQLILRCFPEQSCITEEDKDDQEAIPFEKHPMV